MLRPIGQALPTLLPLYAAALSLPLFLWLARRAPLSRTNWRATLPIWTLAVLAVALAADAVLLMAVGGGVSLSRMTFYLVLLRLVTRGPPVLVAAALAHTIEHRRRARAAARDAETARAELMQAQLRTLSAQLRPHFLFNTLQSVSTLVHRDAEAADIMIGQLGDLLRASLEFGEATVIPLEDELRITEAYVGIVRERFGDRLDVVYDVDAHARGAQVPPFLLQPLVENAVEHGIEPARAGGRVVIRVARNDGTLILEVTDTGSGRSAADNPAGIGLGTTRRRLQALYGTAAHLDFSSDAATGTRVRIEMPFVALEAIP